MMVTPRNTPTFETGSLAITAGGTAEQLTSHRIPIGHTITVLARSTNQGNLFIGESKVKAEANHVTLVPGANIDLAVDNAHDIWIDAATTGDIVEWIFEAAS